MKLALYRKYRPTSLEQVVGQPQVTDVLSAATKQKAFAHAYLFTGQRGTGKTTVSRILAHLVNGLDYSDNINSDNIDIIEIDAASNNGVDDVREIRDSVQLAPMSCRYKVYIIDEFHMLSKPAFNALLKTIEEPPEYVVFILATTELQKVPATILSRVQRFHFKPLPIEVLAKHLRHIADSEKIAVDDDTLRLIAQAGGGSVRDSITLLDQLSGGPLITVDMVNSVLGLVPESVINDLLIAISSGDATEIVKLVRQITSNGTSATALAGQLISLLENKAVEQPTLYYLIGNLLEVAKSTLPEAKLLAVLIGNALPIADKPVVSPTVTMSPSKPTKSAPKAKPAKNLVANKAVEAPVPAVSTVQEPVKTISDDIVVVGEGNPIKDLVWDDVLQQLADNNCPSTHSLLERCDYRYNPDNNKLTLFFGQDFYRKRAKNKVFGEELLKAIEGLYNSRPAIEISDEKAPVDSAVAAVLNVVGGEVTKINGEI